MMFQFSKHFLTLDINVWGQDMISNAEIEVKNSEPLFIHEVLHLQVFFIPKNV